MVLSLEALEASVAAAPVTASPAIEAVVPEKHQNGFKRTDIIEFVLTKDYEAYADTRVNTVFCKSSLLSST